MPKRPPPADRVPSLDEIARPADGLSMARLDAWKQRARSLRREVYALSLACRDPRVPWYAKALAACVVGYAFSPIDLIPDPVPILGYLDDLVLVPLGVLAVRRMIPREVLAECRQRADAVIRQGGPVNWIAGGVVIVLWVGLAGVGAWATVRLIRSH
jgi:uncharacterized membrane protein YkvA (DUF1232 family)